MKKIPVCLTLIAITFLNACQDQNGGETQALKARIDSLEKQLADTYKPGFGEFMSGIQVHHAKLWFAGLNQNWELADFEVHEMMEGLENIRKYQPERKESEKIPTLNPAIEGVNAAIQKKDAAAFKSSYDALTTACNDCHRSVNYGFNLVKTPERPPFDNQVFRAER